MIMTLCIYAMALSPLPDLLTLGYDLNNDGKVSVEEFKRVMMKTGRVTPEAIEKMLGKADKDSDG